MTLTEILEKAKALSTQEREELIEQLQGMQEPPVSIQEDQPKTGAEIVAMLEALDKPIEFVDEHIQDPVEWVKQIRDDERRKRLGN